ncbi:proteasome inhibitor PI31 subunit-like [Anastrepha ludens]|uniref:proteasome inhibitor PI31 subunit-like n=1 Tax=Anastrepha ludens TaxID=28586 RepID=UPI0023B1C8B6|nr:proteasome inhibitor PI31 subunit-like [Anastrepha ludens]XP_053966183.1 proteasome inhibitor PI31 subunit-like [Anastrepha ludens]
MSSGGAGSSATGAPANDFFGWDLLYKTIEKNVAKKSDVLVALVHFLLVKQYKMQCVGIGEDKTISPEDVGSELLPDGWNERGIRYALRYLHNGRLYLLIGHNTEDFTTFNLLDVKDNKVTNITLSPQEWVKQLKGPLNTLMPEASLILNRYRKEFIDPVFTGNTREVTTQTSVNQDSRSSNFRDPLTIGGPMRPMASFPMEPRPFGFPDVGRGDLDPLGRGGPGNLFPMPSRPSFNSGLNPRFDPVGPNGHIVRADPNPDHLAPPNFGFDYYM